MNVWKNRSQWKLPIVTSFLALLFDIVKFNWRNDEIASVDTSRLSLNLKRWMVFKMTYKDSLRCVQYLQESVQGQLNQISCGSWPAKESMVIRHFRHRLNFSSTSVTKIKSNSNSCQNIPKGYMLQWWIISSESNGRNSWSFANQDTTRLITKSLWQRWDRTLKVQQVSPKRQIRFKYAESMYRLH